MPATGRLRRYENRGPYGSTSPTLDHPRRIIDFPKTRELRRIAEMRALVYSAPVTFLYHVAGLGRRRFIHFSLPPSPPPPPRRGVLFMRGGSIPRGLPKVPAAEDAARRFGFMRANGALFCAVSRRYFRDLGNGACREQIPAREQSPFLQSRTTTTSRRIRLPFVRFAALVNGSAAVYPRTLGDQLCMSEMITRKRERFRRVRIDHLLLNQIREILRR